LGAASLGGIFAGSGFPRRSFRWERPPWEKFSLGAASLGRVFAGSGLPGKSFRWERPPWEKFSLGAASLGKVFAEEAKMAWLGCYGRANIAADSMGANDMSLDLLYTVHDLARKHTVSTFTVCTVYLYINTSDLLFTELGCCVPISIQLQFQVSGFSHISGSTRAH